MIDTTVGILCCVETCDERTIEPDHWPQCEDCGQRPCPGCTVALENVKYCEPCSRRHQRPVCPQCRVYKGHLATCPTQLQTLAQRVALVAKGYTPGTHERVQRRSEELGIPTAEFYMGVRLADEWAEIHRKFVGWHGAPEYGWRNETRAAEAEQMQAALNRIVGEAEAE